MKVIVCLAVLGIVAGALCAEKKNPADLNWHAPPSEPYVKAKPAGPDGGVNFKVEKRPTFYDDGNLKVQGVVEADRNFGGSREGAWNAKVGGRLQYSWDKNYH